MKNPYFQIDFLSISNFIFEVDSVPNWHSNQRLTQKVFLKINKNLVEREFTVLFINSNTILNQNFTFSSFFYEESCNVIVEYGYESDVDQSSSVSILINDVELQVLKPSSIGINVMSEVEFKFSMTKTENKLDIKGSNNMKLESFFLKKVEMNCEV